MSFGTSLLVNWALMLSLLLVLTSLAVYLGWRRRFDLITWRSIKLLSTLLGAIGALVFFSNFELAVRQTTAGAAQQRRVLEFIEAKSRILQQIALSCDEAPTELCGLAQSANGALNYIYIRDNSHLPQIGPIPKDPSGRAFIEDIQKRIKDINDSTSFANEIRPMLPENRRLGFLFLAQLLIIFALAGAAGEAAFQLQDARVRRG